MVGHEGSLFLPLTLGQVVEPPVETLKEFCILNEAVGQALEEPLLGVADGNVFAEESHVCIIQPRQLVSTFFKSLGFFANCIVM